MIKQCIHCGQDFEVDGNDYHARKVAYCSNICRNREHHMRSKGGPRVYNRICLECGKSYIAKRCDSVTCSRECNYERNKRRVRENGAAYREKYRAERLLQKEKAKRKKAKIESIDQVQAKAQAMGMSYGKYLAYMQMQKGAKR